MLFLDIIQLKVEKACFFFSLYSRAGKIIDLSEDQAIYIYIKKIC